MRPDGLKRRPRQPVRLQQPAEFQQRGAIRRRLAGEVDACQWLSATAWTPHCLVLMLCVPASSASYRGEALRRFLDIDLGRESAPDATRLLRFRRLPEDQELTRKARSKCLNRQIRSHLLKTFQIARCIALLSLAPLAATATDNKLEWLLVQTASGFTFDGETLTIPYERELFSFTDRPNRKHAYLNAHELENLWKTGEDNFSDNPPNAVLTWVADGEVREAEIKLLSSSVDERGRSITYEIEFETGDAMSSNAENVSLFIDGAY